MELNASDERGISVVREKVKTFAMGSVGGGGPPFKIIILDEADSLTTDAQAALRRTMETYSRVTRFCIICNYVSRIIEPLASRCSKYRFKPLEPQHMLARLRLVCTAEGVEASDDTLNTILQVSGGDMRKAITFLQSASQLYGGAITPENIVEISGVVPGKALDPLMRNVNSAETTFTTVRGSVQALLALGYSLVGVFDKLVDAVIADASFTSGQKAAMCERIAAAEKRTLDGADEELQLLDVAEYMFRVSRKALVPADKERLPF
jgi:replication factor C subunit 2/4